MYVCMRLPREKNFDRITGTYIAKDPSICLTSDNEATSIILILIVQKGKERASALHAIFENIRQFEYKPTKTFRLSHWKSDYPLLKKWWTKQTEKKNFFPLLFFQHNLPYVYWSTEKNVRLCCTIKNPTLKKKKKKGRDLRSCGSSANQKLCRGCVPEERFTLQKDRNLLAASTFGVMIMSLENHTPQDPKLGQDAEKGKSKTILGTAFSFIWIVPCTKLFFFLQNIVMIVIG